jgi:sortase A
MIRTFIRGVGQTLFTIGLIVLLFAVYQVYGKTWQVAQEKKRLDKELTQEWKKQKNEEEKFNVTEGGPLAKIYIPALGKDWVVVEGTSAKDIKLAPGHYMSSQYPGQNGNFAIAGHRIPAIFWNLDKLDNGNFVVVETALNYHIYQVYKTRIVKPTDVWVIGLDPDNPAATRTNRKLLTLTTCNPKFDNYQRLIVHAELDRTQRKTQGVPKELQ